MTGTIFDIKEFAIYDGPGVRQTVFMKGCPLRCSWCHNPEGLSAMMQLTVAVPSCIHCHTCKERCSKPWNEQFIRAENCISCGKCIDVCPMGLRKLYGVKYSPTELAEIIRKDAEYYAKLGGGVTFSGGEPLLQGEFLFEVLKLLPDIHRCIETSGFADPKLFAKVLSELDYVIMDIKLMNDEKHKHYTGVSNKIILENYEILRKSGKHHVIRIPLIPGVNDDRENLEATAKLLQGDPTLQILQLLPYHKTAEAKYTTAGLTYNPDFQPDQKIEVSTEIFENFNIKYEVL